MASSESNVPDVGAWEAGSTALVGLIAGAPVAAAELLADVRRALRREVEDPQPTAWAQGFGSIVLSTGPSSRCALADYRLRRSVPTAGATP